MNQKPNKQNQNRSFQYNFGRPSVSSKSKKTRNSVYGSPTRNALELKGKMPELKRAGTNEYKKNNDLDNSKLTIFRNRKSTNLQSLKFIEKNIKNKILDISIQIEKEDNNISSGYKGENNLNLSTFIKKQIDGEFDFSPKNKIINSKNCINKSFKNDYSGSNIKLSILQKSDYQKISSFSRIHNNKGSDKYRVLLQKKLVYDSYNSEEEREKGGSIFYISPTGNFVLIFDSLIIFCSLFDIIYTPFRLAKMNGFCIKENKFVNFIYYCIDILYICDLILGFLRSYFNFQLVIIKNKPHIARHYIVTQFWFDFFQAFPVFSYITYLCKTKQNINCGAYDLDNRETFLIIFCFVKQIKLFKIINLKKNSIMYKITEYVSENEFLEGIVDLLITTCVCIFCFYSFISIHIFIGRHSYPNWIIRNGFQDQSIYLLYLTSFYYLITTMTTVGYGDIVVATFSETIFQIIVLSVGITVYSWIVSNIGNYVKNESYASMQFNKDGGILEEIRISHPNMPFRLYKKILQHLNARKIRQKQCDSNLLINSLPYSLKNSLLLTMYRHTIDNFKIFKGCKNSDFIVRLLTNFIPLLSKKNAILIHEGQLVENIIFVKNGRLALQAAIDIEEPEESIKHYLNKNFGDITEEQIMISKYVSSNSNSSFEEKNNQIPIDIARNVLDTVVNTRTKSALNTEINESGLGKEMGKWDYGGEDFEESNYQFLNIINISKNESYGVVYMFFTKPSPLSLRVKSKKVELLLLRKSDALDISQRYPNIWMKFLKKSYFNTLSIKTLAVKKIKHYWENLEKKSKQKMPIVKSKTNLKPFTIYQLKEKHSMDKIISTPNNECFINKSSTNDRTKRKIQFESEVNKIIGSNNSNRKQNVNFSTQNKRYLNILQNNAKPNEIDKNKNNNQIKLNLKSNANLKTNNEKIKSIKSPLNKSNYKVKNKKRRHYRKIFVNKLKTEIKKLKNSKEYYKNLCQKLSYSKVVDSKFVSNNFNSSLLASMQHNTGSTFGKNSIVNQNLNIFHNISPNIINNITIKNNNKILYNSKNKESSNESESFSKSSRSQQKYNAYDMTICCEIDIYYKAKYTNLEVFTSGEFSKNEELRKQALNFIKVFLQIEKRKSQKIKKTNSKNIKNTLVGNPYVNNYEFRHILSKFNVGWKRKSCASNASNAIKSKFNQVLTTLNNEKKNNKKNTYIGVLKNEIFKRGSKITNKRNSKKSKKKNSMRRSYGKEINSPKKTLFMKDKTVNDFDGVKSKNNNTTIAFLKLPTKIKTINEWENENGDISKKSIFESDSKRFIPKSNNSSYEIKNESVFNTIKNESALNTVKNESFLNTVKIDIYSINSEKSINNNQNNLRVDTYNEFPSKNK